MEMFLADGFEATSVEAIATRLSMSKSTFYSRFPSKAAVLEAGVEELSRRLIPARLGRDDDEAPFAERLARAGDILLRVALLPGTIALERLAMAESFRFPQLARVVHDKGTLEVVRSLKAFFDDAVARKEIADIDTGVLAEHFMDIMLIFVRRAAHGIGSQTIDDDARHRLRAITSLVMAGLIIDR